MDKDAIMNREPALVLAAVQAVVLLAVGFGLAINDVQVELIMAAAAAILSLITGVAIRSQVSPAKKP